MFTPCGGQRGGKLPMRLPQCRTLTRRITITAERLLQSREQARQIDVAERGNATGEALAGVRGLRGREDGAERVIERNPVPVGGHR